MRPRGSGGAEGITSFEQMQRRYGGNYVAFLGDRIVGYAPTFSGIQEMMRRMNLLDKPNVRYQFVHPPKPDEPIPVPRRDRYGS